MGKLWVAAALLLTLCACGVTDRMGKRMDNNWASDMLMSDNEKIILISDGGNQLNPDASGKPLSVVVRVYQLTTLERFASADAEGLWDDPKKALGDTLLTSNELVLLPGFGQTNQWPLLPTAGYVAVAAFFRETQNNHWKVAFAADSIRKDGIWFSAKGLRVLVDNDQVLAARGLDAMLTRPTQPTQPALNKPDAVPEQPASPTLAQKVQDSVEQSATDSAKQSAQKALSSKFDSLLEGVHE